MATKLSGNNYVAAYERAERVQPVAPYIWQSRQGTIKLVVAGHTVRCNIAPNGDPQDGHPDNQVCPNCAYQWNWDYQLLLWRTSGGRELAQKLWENGVDMAQFHGYVGTK